MTDEWELRDTAKELAGLYRELDAAKFAQAKPPEIRTMRPAPGPKAPAPDHLISLDEELCGYLTELIGECRTHIDPHRSFRQDGAEMCDWAAHHAQEIADLEVSDDLHTEMKDQTRRIRFKIFGTEVAKVAKLPERRQSAQSICVRMSSMGHRMTPDLLRKWAERGHITRVDRTDGTAGYLATEVLDHITQDKEE